MEINNCLFKLVEFIREELRNGSANLVTRETGRIILTRIEKELRNVNNGGIIAFDFSGIEVIDYSCADEVIAKFLARLQIGEYGDKYIFLQNLSPSQKENIQVALERKNLAVLSIDSEKNWEIIGTLNNYLTDTLKVIMKEGKASTRELSDKLRLELNTASTRLLNLHKAKLVKKCEEKNSNGRRQFIYKSFLK